MRHLKAPFDSATKVGLGGAGIFAVVHIWKWMLCHLLYCIYMPILQTK